MRLYLLFLCAWTVCQFADLSISAQSVSADKFGALGDGIHDDSKALTAAFYQAVNSKTTCFVPTTKAFYLIKSPIRIDLKSGQRLDIVSNGAEFRYNGVLKPKVAELIWKLTSQYDEQCVLSIGPTAEGHPFPDSFANNSGTTVRIRNLKISASLTSQTIHILSALDISAENVFLDSIRIENVEGYGIRSFGPKTLAYSDIKIFNVGGRALKSSSDAYGDGLYIAAIKDAGKIGIRNCTLNGLQSNGLRSRAGITLEFSKYRYAALIESCRIMNFAKSIHIEDEANAIIDVNASTFSNFNYGIAMVKNKQSDCQIINSQFDVGKTDGYDQGDGGPILNTNSGGTYKFGKSVFNFVDGKNAYITMVGVKSLNDCIVNANHRNPFFADADIQFNRCNFFGFGGTYRSFFSFRGNNRFVLINCTFDGQKHAKGVFGEKCSVDFANR